LKQSLQLKCQFGTVQAFFVKSTDLFMMISEKTH